MGRHAEYQYLEGRPTFVRFDPDLKPDPHWAEQTKWFPRRLVPVFCPEIRTGFVPDSADGIATKDYEAGQEIIGCWVLLEHGVWYVREHMSGAGLVVPSGNTPVWRMFDQCVHPIENYPFDLTIPEHIDRYVWLLRNVCAWRVEDIPATMARMEKMAAEFQAKKEAEWAEEAGAFAKDWLRTARKVLQPEIGSIGGRGAAERIRERVQASAAVREAKAAAKSSPTPQNVVALDVAKQRLRKTEARRGR